VGLHSGAKVAMTLLPAETDTGIVFRRTDLAGAQAQIPATWQNAIETPLCTTLADRRGIRISTIEHLMSAFSGCGIDNALVELNGPEVPIMDGSAAPFVFLFECAGIVEQDLPRRVIRVEYDNPAVRYQDWSVEVNPTTYKREIARARTFGFLHEVDELRAKGFARGGSLDNAVVISGEVVINDGGLRFANECVRHKVLDSVGDLYLAGAPLAGSFEGVRAGHALTLRLLQALFADQSAWCWHDVGAPELAAHGDAGGLSAPPPRAVAAQA
jgi:UDP-3-O-[3-hydroxymyristoyl] N-acetylglucosamine deacetylase